MGRTSDARERLIETALLLWFERSYADVGVNEICEEADVRKGSFYHFFPSKTDLALAVIDEQWLRFRTEIVARLLEDESVPPLERLERMMEHGYDFASSRRSETGHVWGCPVGNLAVELSTQDEAVRERLNEFFVEWGDVLSRLLDEAVAAGDLPPQDTHAAGLSLLAYIQGLAVLAKTSNDPELIKTIGPAIVVLAGAPAEVAA